MGVLFGFNNSHLARRQSLSQWSRIIKTTLDESGGGQRGGSGAGVGGRKRGGAGGARGMSDRWVALDVASRAHALPVWNAKSPKSPNKLATKTLTCDTDRTKARTPKCRPAFGCSRRALPGPNIKKSVATKLGFSLLLKKSLKLQKWPKTSKN